MSAAPLLPISSVEPPTRKRFTRSDVERLTAVGFFEGQRYELIDGDLFDKMGQNPPHAFALSLLLEVLARLFPPGTIRVQLPVEVASGDHERSLPEPDLAVLAEKKLEYWKRHPRGDELVLAIEVADSSAPMDLNRKVTLYAAALIPQYWVVDLNRRMIVVHRRPDGATYRLVELLSADDELTFEGRAGEPIRVSSVLPDLT